MRTAVLLSRGPGPTQIVEAELDDPRSDEVIVRIEAVGVCHTDLVTRKGSGTGPQCSATKDAASWSAWARRSTPSP